MELQPDASLRIAPEGPEPRAHVQTVRLRVDDEYRIAPRLALIVAVARQKVGVRPVLPAQQVQNLPFDVDSMLAAIAKGRYVCP